MQPLVIGLVLLSCLMHAGWNLLGRGRREDAVPFFARMNLLTAAMGLVPASWAQLTLDVLDSRSWLLCIASGICLGLYYFFLGKGYERADLSTVYPVARSLPVLLLAGVDAARGRLLSPVALVGMLLVVAGCLLAPQTSWRTVRLRAYISGASVWMLLTALAISGYSMADKLAAETPAALHHGMVFALVYGVVFFAIGAATVSLLSAVFMRHRTPVRPLGWRMPALAAVFNGGSYMLILWAYQQVSAVSTIVAMRQFSVVIGVGLAFWLFREPGRFVRSVAVAFIVAGLLLVALTGA